MSYKTRHEQETTCLECGTAIYGRKDKHFCSPRCKNLYHNREQRQRRDVRLDTITALSRNYEILEALLKEKITSISLSDLVQMGFNPEFVNAIAPGFFLTNQNRTLLTNPDGSLTARGNTILTHTPMGRFGTPDDLSGTLLWLVDDGASGFVNGTVIPVDGGFAAFSGV